MTFETSATATMRVRSLSSAARSSAVHSPCSSTRTARSRAPVLAARRCHGNEVRVVLGLGDDDLVAGFERERASGCPSQPRARIGDAEGDHVDGVGGVLGPHDLALAGADESGDGGAGVFEERGRVADGCARTAVHGSEVVLEVLALGVEHLARSLRGGGGVEVGGGGAAVGCLVEGREVAAEVAHAHPLNRPTDAWVRAGSGHPRPPRHSCIHRGRRMRRDCAVRRGSVYITREEGSNASQ